MNERHPSRETQVEREAAYQDLNKLARKLTIRHGVLHNYDHQARADGFLQMRITAADYDTQDDGRIVVAVQRMMDKDGNNHQSVTIIKEHDGHTLGKQTTYESFEWGAFHRNDPDGNEFGIPEAIENAPDPLSKGLLTAMGIQVFTQKVEAREIEGIDGLPITAEETRDLIQSLESATFVPRAA